MNVVVIEGRLVETPKITKAGTKDVCEFRIANSRFISKGKDPKVCFFNVTAWEGLGRTMVENMEKGQVAKITGHMESSSYEDNDGIKRVSTKIVASTVEFGRKAQNKDKAANTKAATASA